MWTQTEGVKYQKINLTPMIELSQYDRCEAAILIPVQEKQKILAFEGMKMPFFYVPILVSVHNPPGPSTRKIDRYKKLNSVVQIGATCMSGRVANQSINVANWGYENQNFLLNVQVSPELCSEPILPSGYIDSRPDCAYTAILIPVQERRKRAFSYLQMSIFSLFRNLPMQK